jgi:hypothetical protein
MYRNSIKQLIEWKLDNNKKPLVFLGQDRWEKLGLFRTLARRNTARSDFSTLKWLFNG